MPVVVLLWIGSLACGMRTFCVLDAVPGRNAVAPATLLPHRAAPACHDRPSLFLFVHPMCPCSRVTLAELARVVAQHGNELDYQIAVTSLPPNSGQLDQTASWRQASAIRGVVLRKDGDELARRLGAITSGQVLLYDAAGHLRFNGGLTDSRDDATSGAGRRAIEQALRGSVVMPITVPVYGCGLR
jgi:hypothetical protein